MPSDDAEEPGGGQAAGRNPKVQPRRTNGPRNLMPHVRPGFTLETPRA